MSLAPILNPRIGIGSCFAARRTQCHIFPRVWQCRTTTESLQRTLSLCVHETQCIDYLWKWVKRDVKSHHEARDLVDLIEERWWAKWTFYNALLFLCSCVLICDVGFAVGINPLRMNCEILGALHVVVRSVEGTMSIQLGASLVQSYSAGLCWLFLSSESATSYLSLEWESVWCVWHMDWARRRVRDCGLMVMDSDIQIPGFLWRECSSLAKAACISHSNALSSVSFSIQSTVSVPHLVAVWCVGAHCRSGLALLLITNCQLDGDQPTDCL